MKRIKFIIILILFPNVCLGTVWFLTVFEFPILEILRSEFWSAFMTVYCFLVMFTGMGLSNQDINSFNNTFKW
jgi:hypothetical protein